jgi:hypothetical protein
MTSATSGGPGLCWKRRNRRERSVAGARGYADHVDADQIVLLTHPGGEEGRYDERIVAAAEERFAFPIVHRDVDA